MKKRIQGLVIGVLIGAILTSGTAFAKEISENAKIFYKNIKVYVNGAEITPKGSDGSVVEPFIMNGTTYLPVRAVSNALDQDVEWDGKTQSVYIGKKDRTKPDNYLHKISRTNYQEAKASSAISTINGTITDFNGNIYKNGIVFYISSGFGKLEEIDECDSLASYPLNSQYSILMGNIVLPKKVEIASLSKATKCSGLQTDILFYGDGKLLYKATAVDSSMPYKINLNVKDVNTLTIKVSYSDFDNNHIALTDLALYK